MFGKILAGALIGVGAVAAAPFTGGGSLLGAASLAASLTGAGAIAGAVGAGVAGAAVGHAFAKGDKKELDSAKREGEQRAQAKYSLEMEKLTSEITAMLADSHKREQFLVTAFAVGISAANCDGEICDEEIRELDELVCGIGTSNMLSAITKKLIADMRANPPNLLDVWDLVKKHGFTESQHISMFSDIIAVTIQADGRTEHVETGFMNTWHKLAA